MRREQISTLPKIEKGHIAAINRLESLRGKLSILEHS